ncbi:GFA family protein [Alteromonas sp. ASW11-130]|uniref:GFA family protein n=1 Tax=Alteromonas sp. ASW11-130 TaxID=3015775 RepID=UPI00224297CE|nr:GFA family protein [Alteromonas sp. ASW11-130]MCW8093087.1 GFA family protein [Alteromonas sp. ASW11-130]
MQGECLCGSVKFEIDGEVRNLYQCHCSLCRKATGAAANAATFVQEPNFRWVSGENDISSYSKPSGFRSDFCSVCGSPVPNSLRGSGMVWIPAGLLAELVTSRVAVHLHTDSAAPWEQESRKCVRLSGGPDSLEALNKFL